MRKANITVEYETDKQIFEFELFLRQQIEVVDFTLLPDSQELYDSDNTFKQLCKKVKDARRTRDQYYNDKR